MRQCLVLFLLFSFPATLLAQRYGRPYTLAENPQLLLQIKVERNHRYFRVADLRKMPRIELTQKDPLTGQTHTYDGVPLEQLVPASLLTSAGETLEVEFGAHQSLLLSGAELDSGVKAMVVDTIDGRPLSGEAPYYLLVKVRSKAPQAIPNVACISLKK
jgi:hypothetical protein